ncbi:hypothetical protein G6F46_013892 [Rhizopus delemar]|nr:hypothetical protein G6F46_013892 [Rhizopus delemar]
MGACMDLVHPQLAAFAAPLGAVAADQGAGGQARPGTGRAPGTVPAHRRRRGPAAPRPAHAGTGGRGAGRTAARARQRRCAHADPLGGQRRLARYLVRTGDRRTAPAPRLPVRPAHGRPGPHPAAAARWQRARRGHRRRPPGERLQRASARRDALPRHRLARLRPPVLQRWHAGRRLGTRTDAGVQPQG